MYEIKVSFSPDLKVLLEKLVELLENNPNFSAAIKPKLAYSTHETAEALGVSLGTVHKLIRGQQLKAVQIGRRWVVPAKSLDAFVAKGGTSD